MALAAATCFACAFLPTVSADPPGDGQWELVFRDEFSGDKLALSKWSCDYPWGHTHNHRAYCAAENVEVADGTLRIKAENRRHPDAPQTAKHGGKEYSLDFTSGAIHTKGKFEFTCGYLEGRFKVPATRGFWPAFWTLNSKGGWPPEIDVLEILCHEPTRLYYNYHYGKSWHPGEKKSFGGQLNAANGAPDFSADFHVVGCDWSPDHIAWYVDGVEQRRFTDRESIAQSGDMYLIVNLAVGGWEKDPDETTVWPGVYECDWVRVWKRQ
jgi:beta-glucanase (GH16 family)